MAKPAQVKEVVKDYFDSKKYNYDVEEKEVFNLFSGFKTADSEGKIGLVITVHSSGINAVATYSEEISKKYFGKIAEFMLRVNRYLKRGHFFLDFETGSVNFKIWESIKGRVTTSDIDAMISITIGSMESIMTVIKSITDSKISVVEGVKAYVTKGGSTE